MTLALAEYRLGRSTESLAASEKSLALLGDRDPASGFLTAMANWQKGEKDKARDWFKRAAEWITEKNVRNSTARRLESEAAEIVGWPKQDADGASGPSAKKPR